MHILKSNNTHYIIKSVIVLFALLITGYLSLLLVIPPGFASLIWLPGGIALGVVIIWGLRYLPVIAIGAFLLNIYTTHMHAQLGFQGHIVCALLVIAPLLQIVVAWVLINRSMDIKKPFKKIRDIILFAFFAGPVASLVSASFTVICLLLFHIITKETIFFNWFALWVGRSIGVLIISPILIMLHSTKQVNRTQVYVFFVSPLIIVCLAILSVFIIVNRYEFNRVQYVFNVMGNNQAQGLKNYFDKAVHQTTDVGEYVLTHPQVSGVQLNDYISGLLSYHRSIMSIGWMNQADLGDMIQQLSTQKRPSKRYISIGALLPPMISNKYSLAKQSIQIEAKQAPFIIGRFKSGLASGQPQLIFMHSKGHAQHAFSLLMVPIVQKNVVVASVFSLIDFHAGMLPIFDNKNPYQHISLDFHQSNHYETIYTYENAMRGWIHPKFEINFNAKISLSKHQYFLLKLRSSEWFIRNNYSWLVWVMIVGGLFFCVLMEILLLIVYGQKEIIQEKVDKQAALLEQEEKTNLLLLQSAGEGIFGVNNEGVISFVNPAMCELLGYDAHELIDQSIDVLQVLKKGDANQADIMQTGSCLLNQKSANDHNEIQIKKKDGHWVWVEAIHSKMEGSDRHSSVIMLNDISQQKSTTDQLEQIAHYDLLTGLPNRLSFLDYLDKALANAERSTQRVAVCFLDMDNFKYINDRLGHQIGDEVLAKIPQVLKPFQRQSDYIARLSGDEFAMILHGVSSTEMIAGILTRYLSAFDQPIYVNGNEINVSFSLGVAIYPDNGKTSEELLKNADMAMYKAKEKGKNTFSFFNQEASQEMKRYHLINESFAAAIKENQFYINYQPQVCAKTAEIYGVEALLRWKHPELGMIEPSEFILVAENSGYIKEIGYWLLQQIAKDYSVLMSINRNIKISINVSIKELNDKDFESNINSFLQNNKINPSNIVLEVTETALMRDFESVTALMESLSKLGIGFALDDFGMEYSSLNYLKNLDIDCIKIDKNFVHDMCVNKVSAAIVLAIITLADALKVSVIAEGVETHEQYDFLLKSNCGYIQGYYFSKPISLNNLKEKY